MTLPLHVEVAVALGAEVQNVGSRQSGPAWHKPGEDLWMQKLVIGDSFEWEYVPPYGLDHPLGEMVTCGMLLSALVRTFGDVVVGDWSSGEFFAKLEDYGIATGASIPEAIARLYLALRSRT